MDQYLNKENKTRYHLFDSVRGVCVLGMGVYHTLFDIAMVGGAQYSAGFMMTIDIIRDFGAALFIFLSGICFHYGTHRLRRFIILFVSGVIVSVATYVVMPQATVIFGILTFMSISGGIMVLLQRLFVKIPPAPGFVISLLLFIVLFHVSFGYIGTYHHVFLQMPEILYRNYLTAFLGFPYAGFSSGDYFPLVPWIFIYFAGYFFEPLTVGKMRFKKILSIRIPLISVVGKFSLPVYLVHQPLIFGSVWLITRMLSRGT